MQVLVAPCVALRCLAFASCVPVGPSFTYYVLLLVVLCGSVDLTIALPMGTCDCLVCGPFRIHGRHCSSYPSAASERGALQVHARPDVTDVAHGIVGVLAHLAPAVCAHVQVCQGACLALL